MPDFKSQALENRPHEPVVGIRRIKILLLSWVADSRLCRLVAASTPSACTWSRSRSYNLTRTYSSATVSSSYSLSASR
jgi:hypothetical protein